MKLDSIVVCVLLSVGSCLLLQPRCAQSQSRTESQKQPESAMLEDIQAYLEISETLSTSGQVGYDEIASIKEAGFEVVVNLAPADEERNSREGFLVTQQGMSYIHIPVSWENPSQRDLRLFFDVMEANEDRKVFVHCFANMRVSAFVYLYRTLQMGTSEEDALTDLHEIWDPHELEQWSAFIKTARQKASDS